MISAEKIQGSWNELRGEIKQRWGQLTDDELKEFDGNLDSLVGRIQRKTGESRQAIESYLEELLSEGASMLGQTAETAKQYVSSATETAKQYASTATETAKRYASSAASAVGGVAEQTKASYDTARRTVQQRPTESVAVAFAAGMIAGVAIALLFRSR